MFNHTSYSRHFRDQPPSTNVHNPRMIQGDLRVEKNQFKSELSPFMTNFMTEKLSRLPFSFSWTSPFNYSERKEKKMLTTKRKKEKK